MEDNYQQVLTSGINLSTGCETVYLTAYKDSKGPNTEGVQDEFLTQC